MVQYEVTRKELLDKQQRKIDELERRAKVLEKQKAENEVAWIEKQREFELVKVCFCVWGRKGRAMRGQVNLGRKKIAYEQNTLHAALENQLHTSNTILCASF